MSIIAEAVWAASPTTARGQPTPLSSDGRGERIAYASNKSIFVRSIDEPRVAKQYTQHTAATSVARFSPSGFYVASGDVSGSVRVWDAAGAENTKGEYHVLAGRINDIAWDGDSQRIIAVGAGKERYGHCITADSGNSVGEISGHSQPINCVSVRQQRPLRAATGGDDAALGFFHGAPFKFNTSVRGKHDRFIYGTQFSPDGSRLVSVGGDRRIWLYDGRTGEPTGQIGAGTGAGAAAHTGSIFGVSWAADGKRLVTCSGDQTVKVWDVEADSCTQTWRMGSDGATGVSVPDQQVGVTWPAGRTDGLIVSVDVAGNLNYLQSDSERPVRVVRGHQKAITAATAAHGGDTLWTGSYDGRVRAWHLSTGAASRVDGESHGNLVAAIAAEPGEQRVFSAGWDDTLRTINTSSAGASFAGSVVATDAQPKGVAVANIGGTPHALVATSSGIAAYADGAKVSEQKTPSPPTCVAAHAGTVAVGADDKTVRLFAAGTPAAFDAMITLGDATAPISALAFSPDGSHLAVGLANGKILAYARDAGSGSWSLATNRWSAHTARVTCLAWSPDCSRAVSGALDTNVFVWSLADPGKRVRALNAHKDGVGGVAWTAPDSVVSCGADAAVKIWKVTGVP